MASIPAAAVIAAAARLRGHVIATPLIGCPWVERVVGANPQVDLRWKADMLQPGGSGWFRGFHHLLLRSYGALPGLGFAGPPELMLAAAAAARAHRLSLVAFVGLPPGPALAAALQRAGVELEVVAEPAAAAARLQRQRGFVPLPLAEHPEVATGLATAGLELGAGLPADCAVVYVAAGAAAATRAGLAAAGRDLRVVGVEVGGVDEPARERLAAAVRQTIAEQHRLELGATGAAVLAAACADPEGGAIGALLLD